MLQSIAGLFVLLASTHACFADGPPPVAQEMFVAMTEGVPSQVDALLNAHPELVSFRGPQGDSFLHLACGQNGSSQIVRILLEHGADANARNDANRTPLHRAAYGSHDERVAILLRSGADINSIDSSGWTPIWAAILGNNIQVVDLLLTNGADVAHVDNQGRPPTHLAVHDGRLDILKKLADAGADLHYFDQSGQSLTELARSKGHHDIVQFLEARETADHGR